MMGRSPAPVGGLEERATLTPKQWAILRDLATGATYRDVAYRHGISYQTAKRHIYSAYQRLSVGCAIEAFAALGWLIVPDE